MECLHCYKVIPLYNMYDHMVKSHDFEKDDFKHPDYADLGRCHISEKEKESVLKQNKFVYVNAPLVLQEQANRHSIIHVLAPILRVPNVLSDTVDNTTVLKSQEPPLLQELNEMIDQNESESMDIG